MSTFQYGSAKLDNFVTNEAIEIAGQPMDVEVTIDRACEK